MTQALYNGGVGEWSEQEIPDTQQGPKAECSADPVECVMYRAGLACCCSPGCEWRGIKMLSAGEWPTRSRGAERRGCFIHDISVK